MPERVLNRLLLKEHFRKSALIYLIGIVVVTVFSMLLFEATTPQIPAERTVLIHLVDDFSNTTPLDGLAERALTYGKTVDPTLESVRFVPINYGDPSADSTGMMVLMARMVLGEADAYLTSETALPALTREGAYLPLEMYWAQGWLSELEPYRCTDERTGEIHVAALRLKDMRALAECNVFDSENAYLVIAANGTNIETTMKTVEFILGTLQEEDDGSGTSGAE